MMLNFGNITKVFAALLLMFGCNAKMWAQVKMDAYSSPGTSGSAVAALPEILL